MSRKRDEHTRYFWGTVLMLSREGRTDSEIAATMSVVPHRVTLAQQRIYHELDVTCVEDAVAAAVEAGWMTISGTPVVPFTQFRRKPHGMPLEQIVLRWPIVIGSVQDLRDGMNKDILARLMRNMARTAARRPRTASAELESFNAANAMSMELYGTTAHPRSARALRPSVA